MKQKIRFTLGKKIVVMLLVMSVILCGTALFVSYRTYRNRTMTSYQQLGQSVVRTMATQIDPDELDRYYETLETDERYYEIQNFILDLVESNGVEYLYIVRPNGVGVTFLFDSDMQAGENGDYSTGGYCSLGTYTDLVGDFADNLDSLLAGGQVAPIIQQDPAYGWLMTVMVPVCHENGAMAGYVMADINMNDVVQEQQNFLIVTGSILAVLTLAFVLIYLLLIRRSFIRPIQMLTAAAQEYEGGAGQARAVFSSVEIRGKNELSTLADAFRMMLAEINLNTIEQKELAVREQKLEGELQLASELNASMLPKELPGRAGGYPFRVCGNIFRDQGLSYNFYDYFLLDQDRLCVMLGEVPGSGISGALYTVMAQTAVKSQVNSGLPLAEAMTAANRQLHEMSSSLYLNVLVGVLDGTTGRFSCINAGQQDPLLMRSQDRYEWMKTLSYAPLGQCENVVYQVVELELRQGDRIFFHTRGLDEIQDSTGREFSTAQLRLSLNQGRQMELERQLQNISDAGRVYADQISQLQGYALLALEYRRRDKAQAYCVLTADGAGSAQLQRFLKEQLEANRLQDRRIASLMVAADELFTLCRSRAGRKDRFMAECAVPPGEDMVVLRLKGAMNGVNPLEHPDGDPAKHAAAFIVQNTDRILFEHGDDMDIITIVKRVQRGDAARAMQG